MKTAAFAPMLFALALLAAPAPCRAQQTGPTPQQAAEAAAARQGDAREPPIIDAADVSVRYLRTGSVSAGRAADALAAQARRRFFVRSADGSVSGPYTNIDSFGEDVVVLHDRTTLLPALEEALASFVVVSSQPKPEREVLQVVEYRPRHEKVSSLLSALEPFARQIANDSNDLAFGTTAVSNVTMLPQSGVLILRDTAERLAEIQGLLARIDIPAPQVMLTCLLIQDVPSAESADPTAGLPADLVRDLRELLPVQALHRVGQAALRIAIVPGSRVTLSGVLESGQNFDLMLVATGYDREQGSLSVTDCSLRRDGGVMFTTSAVLAAGENTVLGASGTEPLFVVLRVVPLDG